jgi:hypothetical protein
MSRSIRSFRRALGMARIATIALVRGGGQSNRNRMETDRVSVRSDAEGDGLFAIMEDMASTVKARRWPLSSKGMH